MTFQIGDRVLLTKPEKPFPSHWIATPDRHPVLGRRIFGIRESAWDNYKDQVHTITGIRPYLGCPAVAIKSNGYLWPIECISLANGSPISLKISCDCPLNVILARGCQKKEHY